MKSKCKRSKYHAFEILAMFLLYQQHLCVSSFPVCELMAFPFVPYVLFSLVYYFISHNFYGKLLFTPSHFWQVFERSAYGTGIFSFHTFISTIVVLLLFPSFFFFFLFVCRKYKLRFFSLYLLCTDYVTFKILLCLHTVLIFLLTISSVGIPRKHTYFPLSES